MEEGKKGSYETGFVVLLVGRHAQKALEAYLCFCAVGALLMAFGDQEKPVLSSLRFLWPKGVLKGPDSWEVGGRSSMGKSIEGQGKVLGFAHWSMAQQGKGQVCKTENRIIAGAAAVTKWLMTMTHRIRQKWGEQRLFLTRGARPTAEHRRQKRLLPKGDTLPVFLWR